MTTPETIAMREEIFKQYRESQAQLDKLSAEFDELQQKMMEYREKRSKVSEENQYLKGLIDIMLLEDCDPVMAKLKYAERLEKMKNEDAASSEYDPRYSVKASQNTSTLGPKMGITQKIFNAIRK